MFANDFCTKAPRIGATPLPIYLKQVALTATQCDTREIAPTNNESLSAGTQNAAVSVGDTPRGPPRVLPGEGQVSRHADRSSSQFLNREAHGTRQEEICLPRTDTAAQLSLIRSALAGLRLQAIHSCSQETIGITLSPPILRTRPGLTNICTSVKPAKTTACSVSGSKTSKSPCTSC